MGFNLCPRAIHEWISPLFHKIFVYSTSPLITTIKANGTMYGLACALLRASTTQSCQAPRCAARCCMQHPHPPDEQFFDEPSVLPLLTLRVVPLRGHCPYCYQLSTCFGHQLLPALCYPFGRAHTPSRLLRLWVFSCVGRNKSEGAFMCFWPTSPL